MDPANQLTLSLNYLPGVSQFIRLATDENTISEVAAFGTRGDGKTQGAFGAMVVHAERHRSAGASLPVRWIGVTDTFRSHQLKTIRSLTEEFWLGAWKISEQGHVATFAPNGVPMIELDLFGIEDQGAMERVRTACHAVWFEEPAPAAVLVSSSGVSEDAWGLASTSARLPSYKHPKIMTLNYPDEDHWTWQRFVERQHEGTAYVRISPGERATAVDRAEWARALAGRPDLLRRLLAGEPGVIALGPQVALGFNPLAHVAAAPLLVDKTQPLYLGWDSGVQSHAHATIIGQHVGAQVRIYAGLVTEDAGLRQHLEHTVFPWFEREAPHMLREHAGWLYHAYDQAMDVDEGGDIEQSPLRRAQRELRGAWEAGPVSWPGRINPLLALFNLGAAGSPCLQITPGPDTELLRKALSGRWYYKQLASGQIVRDLPHKPNHPWEDLGDALCYFAGRVAPSRVPSGPRQQSQIAFSPFDHAHRPRTAIRNITTWRP